MTERIKGFLICIFIVFLFVAVFSPVNSGLASNAFAEMTDGEVTPILDKSRIRMMIEKATPLIEEITGRRFISEIDYRIIGRTALQKLLLKGELEGLKKWMSGMGEFMIKRRAESSSQEKSRFYIGRYFKQSQILYVVPDNIQNAIELYNINDDDLNDFLFIIIAHEMVHAIDNQHYDLSGLLMKTRTSEEYMALSAAIGGSAAYVTGIIAKRLNISEASLKNSLKLDICMMNDENNANKREVFNLYYIKGEEFLRTVMREKGVTAAYDAIFKSPPVLTRQVLFPEEYSNRSGSDALRQQSINMIQQPWK